MDEPIYRSLAEHLDRLPGGFPPSSTGAEIPLLQRLFTPQEAQLAVHLRLEPELSETIAARAGLERDETVALLETMAIKGVIWFVESAEMGRRYHAIPWVVGIWEMQLNRLDEPLLHDVSAYRSTRGPQPSVETIRQMRTIPISESIAYQPGVLPYQHIEAMVDAQDRYAVSPCICRRVARINGQGCEAPEESCLSFGDMADYIVSTDRGRAISHAEVSAILERADAANLVLQPSNSRDPAFVCTCCGCCCGILRGLQREAKPAKVVANDYIASFDSDLCVNCGACLERCQMQALSAGDEHVLLNEGRCIGCGLCVTTCPSGALTLELKPEEQRAEPPATLYDTWQIIAREQAKQRGLGHV